jgi:ABC-type microcin C transport system permease subunit YejB
MEKLWFRRKRYGYGWVPSTWQGWVIVLVYVISIAMFGNLAKNYTEASDIVIGFVIPTFIFTILLLTVCWAKGEKPKWQWGEKNEK